MANVMRSFGTFAPKPDIAGTFQRSQQLALQAADMANRIQMQRQQLAQQREIANMESQMRMRQQNQDFLMKQQALSVDRDYKNQMIRFQDQKLEMEANQLARQYQAQDWLLGELGRIDQDKTLSQEDRERATSGALLRSGAMGFSVPYAGSLMKSSQEAHVPKPFSAQVGGRDVSGVYSPSTGRYDIIPDDSAIERAAQQRGQADYLKQLESDRSHLQRKLWDRSLEPIENDPAIGMLQSELHKIDTEVARLRGLPEPPAPEPRIPVNPVEDEKKPSWFRRLPWGTPDMSGIIKGRAVGQEKDPMNLFSK
jgi:hypothetical protein